MIKKISIIESKFLRTAKAALFTKLWKQLEENDKAFVLSVVNIEVDEKAILCFLPNRTNWWVLTNQNLVIVNSTPKYYSISGLSKVGLTEVFEKDEGKKEATSIDLVVNGENLRLPVEKGLWPPLYSLFKFIIESN